MNQTLVDYYRIPAGFVQEPCSAAGPSGGNGFFRFGPSNVCYGRSTSGVAASFALSAQFDAVRSLHRNGGPLRLPFDFAEIIDNLRLERYLEKAALGRNLTSGSWIKSIYYNIRESLPDSVRRRLQQIYLGDWRKLPFPAWPVDFTVDNLHEAVLQLMMEHSKIQRLPFIWFWPDGASNCLIMTHDVETAKGRDFSIPLIELDASYGFRSSFQVIPEKRYEVPADYVLEIRKRGCEFNVHDLDHDGRLYQERNEFLRRAAKINNYARLYKTVGFRSGGMYRNQDWYEVFDFSYDMSVPNVAHLEPMRGGCCTVMPYFVGKILELPLTTAQDYSLFHILNDYSIDLWKRQVSLLRQRHGLMSFVTHPDYLIDRRARGAYESLLDYLRELTMKETVLAVLPSELNAWWRQRSQMQLVPRENGWEIVGAGHERARLAYAVLEDGRLVYELA